MGLFSSRLRLRGCPAARNGHGRRSPPPARPPPARRGGRYAAAERACGDPPGGRGRAAATAGTRRRSGRAHRACRRPRPGKPPTPRASARRPVTAPTARVMKPNSMPRSVTARAPAATSARSAACRRQGTPPASSRTAPRRARATDDRERRRLLQHERRGRDRRDEYDVQGARAPPRRRSSGHRGSRAKMMNSIGRIRVNSSAFMNPAAVDMASRSKRSSSPGGSPSSSSSKFGMSRTSATRRLSMTTSRPTPMLQPSSDQRWSRSDLVKTSRQHAASASSCVVPAQEDVLEVRLVGDHVVHAVRRCRRDQLRRGALDRQVDRASGDLHVVDARDPRDLGAPGEGRGRPAPCVVRPGVRGSRPCR